MHLCSQSRGFTHIHTESGIGVVLVRIHGGADAVSPGARKRVSSQKSRSHPTGAEGSTGRQERRGQGVGGRRQGRGVLMGSRSQGKLKNLD